MQAITSLALKDLKLLRRDKGALFFTIGFPLIFGLFFGFIFAGSTSSPSGLSIAVVDQDDSEASGELLSLLGNEPMLELVYVDDESTASEHVRLGSAGAYVLIEPGFESSLDQMMLGGRATVALVTDPGRPTAGTLVEGLLNKATGQVFGSLFSDGERMIKQVQTSRASLDEMGLNVAEMALAQAFLNSLEAMLDGVGTEKPTEKATNGTATGVDTDSDTDTSVAGLGMPISVERRLLTRLDDGEEQQVQPSSIFAITFAQAMVWAMIGCCASFSSSMSEERTLGTLVRLRMSPLRMSHVLLGKALACFTGSFIVATGFLLLSIVGFGVRPVDWGMLLLSLVMACAAFCGLMLLIASVARSRTSPSQMAWGVMLVLALIGGGMLPLEFMPDWLRSVSHLSPVKWAILAVEGGVWRGFGLREMAAPIAVLVGIAALGFSIGITVLSRVPMRV